MTVAMPPRSSSPPHLDPEPSSDQDVLSTFFLNAKRSLSSTHLGTRAQDIVETAKTAIHEASIISARCVFLRNSLQDQLTIASQINRMMQSRQDGFHSEFKTTLTELDEADHKLNQTLSLLRDLIVDPAFVSDDNTTALTDGAGGSSEHIRNGLHSSELSSEASAEGSRNRIRTLHNFVDDEAIEALKSRLRSSIDNVQESHDTLATALNSFNSSLGSLSNSLNSLPSSQETLSLPPSLDPKLILLTSQSESIGTLITQLTSHFDRCTLALKTVNEHGPLPDDGTIQTLAHDAALVDDVVEDIKSQLASMEREFAHISDSLASLHDLHRNVTSVFTAFDSFQTQLFETISTLREFEHCQEELKLDMETRLGELWQLGEFYDGFIGAYDAMVVEVGRRQGIENRMAAVIKAAMKGLQDLYEEDIHDQEIFKEEYGQWLPVDIWPGLGDPPVRWEIERDLQGGREVPPLKKDVIERAFKRHTRRLAAGKGAAAKAL